MGRAVQEGVKTIPIKDLASRDLARLSAEATSHFGEPIDLQDLQADKQGLSYEELFSLAILANWDIYS